MNAEQSGEAHLNEKRPLLRPQLTAAKTGTQLHPTRTTTVSWTAAGIPSAASTIKRRRLRRQHLPACGRTLTALGGFKHVLDPGLSSETMFGPLSNSARLPVLLRMRASDLNARCSAEECSG